MRRRRGVLEEKKRGRGKRAAKLSEGEGLSGKLA
jgi:hypothetical protein